MSRIVRLALLGAAALTLAPMGAGAQLISPGKLSSAHAQLEGIRNCTRCHELRKQGISEGLCLGCHEALSRRIGAGKGFHGALPDQACGACHKEHFGADFALVRLDTLSFDHERTGYALAGGHADASCRSCHTPEHIMDPAVRDELTERGGLERTFLGLGTLCARCHETDSPHDAQFGNRSCASCHDTGGWKEAPLFDHAKAAFPLTGRHRAVTCDQCHEASPRPGKPDFVRYAGVPGGQCNDCHEDQHKGAMPGPCAGCHATQGWKELDRRRLETSFNHGATGFALQGAHARAPCAACHQARKAGEGEAIHLSFVAGTSGATFPRPEHRSCLSCHRDEHEGAMPERCEACHGTERWNAVDARRLSSSFDHASTGFMLEGGHATAACAACHDERAAKALVGVHLAFEAGTEGRAFPRPLHATCLACHDDRHAGAFEDAPSGADCRSCHSPTGWTPASFDARRHGLETPFALEGAHAAVACVDCHVPTGEVPSFRVTGTECRSCHESANPHGDQFAGRSCDACHVTDAFGIADFDHDGTRFPLDGAHRDASCQACHKPEPDPRGGAFVRYRPLGTECRDCHGGLP